MFHTHHTIFMQSVSCSRTCHHPSLQGTVKFQLPPSFTNSPCDKTNQLFLKRAGGSWLVALVKKEISVNYLEYLP